MVVTLSNHLITKCYHRTSWGCPPCKLVRRTTVSCLHSASTSTACGRGFNRDIAVGMAMTLRLDEQEADALRQRAEREGRSLEEVARQAVSNYGERSSRRDLLDRVLEGSFPHTRRRFAGSRNDLPRHRRPASHRRSGAPGGGARGTPVCSSPRPPAHERARSAGRPTPACTTRLRRCRAASPSTA